MWLTSSLFNQIASERIEVLVPLKYLLIGGEVLNAKWVDLLNQKPKHPQIINGYGPTENTTFTTTYNIYLTKFQIVFLLVNQFYTVLMFISCKASVGVALVFLENYVQVALG